jgi:hypothetical protein
VKGQDNLLDCCQSKARKASTGDRSSAIHLSYIGRFAGMVVDYNWHCLTEIKGRL